MAVRVKCLACVVGAWQLQEFREGPWLGHPRENGTHRWHWGWGSEGLCLHLGRAGAQQDPVLRQGHSSLGHGDSTHTFAGGQGQVFPCDSGCTHLPWSLPLWAWRRSRGQASAVTGLLSLRMAPGSWPPWCI